LFDRINIPILAGIFSIIMIILLFLIWFLIKTNR
jgi:hypothetical protein